LRALRELELAGAATIADALNRTAFEVLDDEERAIRSAFSFVSESTAKFLGRGFYFRKATPNNLMAKVIAKPKSSALLIGHVRGDTIRAGAEHLSFRGDLAVPIPGNIKRSVRGKVAKRLLPSEVVKPGGRGFVAYGGSAILQRVGKKRLPIRILYALEPSALLAQRFDHIATARATFLRVFPAKAKRAIEKAAERARAKA
jgi:hypothetical protein